MTYIFDVDGTLADIKGLLRTLPMFSHSPKEWKPWGPAEYAAFEECCGRARPIVPTCRVATGLIDAGADVVFVTARHERVRATTRRWLHDHVVRPGLEYVESSWVDDRLFMREDDDRSEDYDLKSRIMSQLIAGGRLPIAAFEDRRECVDMYRARGLTVMEVGHGAR